MKKKKKSHLVFTIFFIFLFFRLSCSEKRVWIGGPVPTQSCLNAVADKWWITCKRVQTRSYVGATSLLLS